MWARLRTSVVNNDERKPKLPPKGPNVNEEYLCAVRTESYADFFSKFQMIANESLSEILLDPSQETIASILESSPVFSDNLKTLFLNFFDVSAEASKFCSQLLKNLSQVQSDYSSIHRIIDQIDGHYLPSDGKLGAAVSAVLNNPNFSDLKNHDFRQFQDQHSEILQNLKSKKKWIARKIKLIKCINKASGVCLAAAYGVVAASAVFLAIHTFAAALMGPALLGFPIKPLTKKIRNLRITKYGFLRRAAEQLDAAAKGVYILNRDFDTMSRMVGRVQDEIEHSKEVMRVWSERQRLPWQVVTELKKYGLGLRRQAAELEEHVYLCLLTINRARALLVKEIHL